MYIISGKHSILSASRNSKRGKMIFYGTPEFYNELELTCPFQRCTKNYLRTSEIAVFGSPKEMMQQSRLLLLDGLEDPRNVGSIIRSAAAFGYGVVLRSGKGCEINETVVRCAAGGVDLTSLFLLKNASTTLEKLKDERFVFLGLDENGTEFPNRSMDKVLLVIGSEGFGISRLVSERLDQTCSISTLGQLKTLNASVAAAISMNYLAKQY